MRWPNCLLKGVPCLAWLLLKVPNEPHFKCKLSMGSFPPMPAHTVSICTGLRMRGKGEKRMEKIKQCIPHYIFALLNRWYCSHQHTVKAKAIYYLNWLLFGESEGKETIAPDTLPWGVKRLFNRLCSLECWALSAALKFKAIYCTKKRL